MSDVRLDFQPNKPHSTKGTLIVFAGNDTRALHSDTLDVANDKRRTAFIEKLTKEHQGICPDKVQQAILELIGRITSEIHKADEKADSKKIVEPLENTPQEVKDDAMAALRSPDLLEHIYSDITSMGVAGEHELSLTIYVVMTSRLIEKPLSAIVQGASSSGKTFTIEVTVKLMPPEAVVQAHDFTDQVFYYMPEGSLQHKLVISGERLHEHQGKDGEARDNSKAFREMVGSGYLRKAVTIKLGGQLTSKIIQQPGPIAYIESTTATTIQDEDATRLLPLVTDESTEQTEMIMEAQKKEAKGQRVSKPAREAIIQRHHTMQRLLRPLEVEIPFIDSIQLPKTNIATRRTFGHLVSMIKTVAILRQYQKQAKKNSDGVEYIEADEVDYEITYQLMRKILARTYSGLNQKSRDLLDIVLQNTEPEPSSTMNSYRSFTNQDCQAWTGLSEPTVRRRLGPLVWRGIVAVDKSSKPYQYRVDKPELAESIDIGLPDPTDIAERLAIMSA